MKLNRFHLLPVLCSLALPGQQAPPSPETIKVTAEEVVLDVVVRDKKGKPIKDLTPEEITVTDNGSKQKIISFRLVEGKEAIAKGSTVPLDPLHQLRLVTLVFERLGVESRRVARQAAIDLVKGEQAQNVFYAVVAIDQRLWPLQDFTRDKESLRKAIELATSGQYSQYSVDADSVKARLQSQITNPQPIPGAGGDFGSAATGERLAQIMISMLSMDASFSLQEATRMSIFGLSSLVKGQFTLPGRKTLLYFSEGMWVPTNLDVPFRNLISTANRGNVSIYSVDTRGVMTWGQNSGVAAGVRDAANETAKDVTRLEGAVTVGAVKASETAENAMRNNVQVPLRNLAEDTGGFLIGESNDLRMPLRHVNEEINSYYEITYNPGIERFDGAFRKTEVDVARKDLVVHHRTGYFALPVSTYTAKGPSVLPYELPLLNALNANPMPKDVEFRTGALRLQPEGDKVKQTVMIEVPLSGITLTDDAALKASKGRVSVVALVKDEKGEVVGKLTRDLNLNVPAAMLAQTKQSNFTYKDQVNLPPGHYTVNAAVLDHESGKIGAKKVSLIVPPIQSGVHISSLSLVRSYQQGVKDLDPNEPFQFQGGRVNPTLSGTVYNAKGSQLSLFFVAYPDKSIADKPVAKVEFLLDGQVLAQNDLPLPAADAQGRIPYVISIPAESMPPGNYEVHVTVKQGPSSADDRTKVTVATL